MNRPQGLEEGGTDSWKFGELTRQLKAVRLLNLDPSSSVSGAAQALRFTVLGLSDDLTVHVAVAIASATTTPVIASDYPAAPGNMQLTPIVKNPEVPKIYLRPVFQNPANVLNVDDPLPQELPFGWSFEPEGANEVRCDVVIPAGAYDTTGIEGTLVATVTCSYTGSWPDPKAIERAFGRVRVMGADDNIPSVGTGGL